VKRAKNAPSAVQQLLFVLVFSLIVFMIPASGTPSSPGEDPAGEKGAPAMIPLSKPPFPKTMSIEETLEKRRSVRRFAPEKLTGMEISRLLWAAQGITGRGGLRTAPSAGALYPLEVYLVLPEGIYRYEPAKAELLLHRKGNALEGLSRAALGQSCVRDAPAVIVLTAVYGRVTGKYGGRGERYVLLEAGHAAQNIHLEAVALGLGSVPVGAFRDDGVRSVLELPPDHEPVYLIPVGRPR